MAVFIVVCYLHSCHKKCLSIVVKSDSKIIISLFKSVTYSVSSKYIEHGQQQRAELTSEINISLLQQIENVKLINSKIHIFHIIFLFFYQKLQNSKKHSPHFGNESSFAVFVSSLSNKFQPNELKKQHTVCTRSFGKRNGMLIYKSLLNTFIVSNNFLDQLSHYLKLAWAWNLHHDHVRFVKIFDTQCSRRAS